MLPLHLVTFLMFFFSCKHIIEVVHWSVSTTCFSPPNLYYIPPPLTYEKERFVIANTTTVLHSNPLHVPDKLPTVIRWLHGEHILLEIKL